jgi:hypothetical protein
VCGGAHLGVSGHWPETEKETYVIRRITFQIAILLCLAVPSTALGAHSLFAQELQPVKFHLTHPTREWWPKAHCGHDRVCIANVAHRLCRYDPSDAWHCTIWRRWKLEREAHIASIHQPITACETIACDQAFLVQQVGSAEAACAEGVIKDEDNTYAPVRYFGDNPANSPYDTPYGIPQANPGSKMASAGADWLTSATTQLRWMIEYVKQRYGDFCGALANENAYHSY